MMWNILHLTVLFQVGFGIGVNEKEREIPEIKEEDPGMHTVFIHSDSKEAQERYFDWKYDNGEMDNWKIPRIITTLEKKDQHDGVKKMLETVDGREKPNFHGRFTNQEALVHVLDNPVDPNDSKLDNERQEDQMEHDVGQDKDVKSDSLDEGMEDEPDASKTHRRETPTPNYSILLSQLQSEDTLPISIHADSNETLQALFDQAEKSGVLSNLKNPVMITVGSKVLEEYGDFPPPTANKFTTMQRLWMLRGEADDDDDDFQIYRDYRKYTDRFGVMTEVFISTDTELSNEQLETINSITHDFSTATFVIQQGKLYTVYEESELVYKLVPLNNGKKESFKKQWKQIQMPSFKHFDLNMRQYLKSDDRQKVLKGYWEQTCENLDWALNMKLTTNQNIAFVCLLHDIRKRRFKYEVPSNTNQEDCIRNPSKCEQKGDDGPAYNLHVEDGTGFSKKEYRNYSDIYLFFPGAGSFEPMEVAYFEIEPVQEAIRFSALGEFLQPTAFIALVLFGLFFTVFVKYLSQAERSELFLFIVGGIFEQGYPFLNRIRRRTNGVLWRGFLGMRMICFLWLLAWFFFRQYLSGSLIASLSSRSTPKATYNHSKLIDFLGKKGAPFVQPMRKDEEDWVWNSYRLLSEDFPYLLTENKITFSTNPTNPFPEMKFLECVLSKSLSEDKKESCKEFQPVMGKSFAYTSTKRRLKTIKKMAQLINPDVYVYEKNVETPFMKPNVISTRNNRISTLLWDDILYMTESGIFEKWQKLDSELEALTDCVKFVARIHNVKESEARGICQKILRAPRPSAAERAFGKFEPISMRVISVPMIFFALSLGGCCIIFAFEIGFFAWLKVYLAVKIWIWCLTILRFTVRCKILYRSLKECDRKDLLMMFHWTNIYKFLAHIIRSASCRLQRKMSYIASSMRKGMRRLGRFQAGVCQFLVSMFRSACYGLRKMGNMASWMRPVLGYLGQVRPWARPTNQVIELENVSTNIRGIGDNRSGHAVMNASSLESECSEINLSVQEEERVAFLLEMIEKYDILQFPDEDMELLQKAKVIITPEEAEALMRRPRSEEDEVQEIPARPVMPAREAWVEKPSIESNETQGGEENPQYMQTQLEGLQMDLGEGVNFMRPVSNVNG